MDKVDAAVVVCASLLLVPTVGKLRGMAKALCVFAFKWAMSAAVTAAVVALIADTAYYDALRRRLSPMLED